MKKAYLNSLYYDFRKINVYFTGNYHTRYINNYMRKLLKLDNTYYFQAEKLSRRLTVEEQTELLSKYNNIYILQGNYEYAPEIKFSTIVTCNKKITGNLEV